MLSKNIPLKIFTIVIFVVKVLFIVTGIGLLFEKIYTHLEPTGRSKMSKSQLDKLQKLHDFTDNLFRICMGILLIVIFNPRSPMLYEIDFEIEVFLTVFGIITLAQIPWSRFFTHVKNNIS